MKRRSFLKSAVGTIASASILDISVAAKPCPPELSGATSSSCSARSGSLAEAASSIGPGQSVQFTKNILQNVRDIQWNCQTIFYDRLRSEIQYMGKPASSQPGGTEHSHYLYSEVTDSWTAIARPLATGFGHIWSITFDESSGTLYYGQNAFNRLWIFDRSAGAVRASWSQGSDTVTDTGQDLTSGGLGAQLIGWHPNLFGPGEGGVYAQGAFRAFAYNPRIDRWSLLMDDYFTSGTGFRDRNNGQMLYLPAIDSLIVFSGENGNSGGDPALLIAAGAGNATNIITEGYGTVTSEPPIEIRGAGGYANQGHIVAHPDDPNRLLCLDEHGTSRVWDSTDYGATWDLKAYTHPFQAMNNLSAGEYTVGTIAPHGVVIGMTSDESGGETVLWKPNS